MSSKPIEGILKFECIQNVWSSERETAYYFLWRFERTQWALRVTNQSIFELGRRVKFKYSVLNSWPLARFLNNPKYCVSLINGYRQENRKLPSSHTNATTFHIDNIPAHTEKKVPKFASFEASRIIFDQILSILALHLNI